MPSLASYASRRNLTRPARRRYRRGAGAGGRRPSAYLKARPPRARPPSPLTVRILFQKWRIMCGSSAKQPRANVASFAGHIRAGLARVRCFSYRHRRAGCGAPGPAAASPDPSVASSRGGLAAEAIQELPQRLQLLDCFRASPLAMTKKVETYGGWSYRGAAHWRLKDVRSRRLKTEAGMLSVRHGQRSRAGPAPHRQPRLAYVRASSFCPGRRFPSGISTSSIQTSGSRAAWRAR